MKLVSVILPVYNGERYIRASLESLLSQTYSCFEIIVIDDCSTDRTREIVNQMSDTRIRYFRNEENQGIVYSLNKAIKLSLGSYIARMDADDICMPSRLEKQVAFLEENEGIDIVSTWFQIFGEQCGEVRYATDPKEIKCRLLFSLQLLHPGWMFRRTLVENFGISYREEYKYAEDWDFLVRASKYVSMSNVDEVLMKYRVGLGQVSSTHSIRQNQVANKVSTDQLTALGIDLTPEEFRIYRTSLGNRNALLTKEEMDILLKIIKLIEEQNKKMQIYDEKTLHAVLSAELFWLCYYNLLHRNVSGCVFLKKGYVFHAPVSFHYKLKLIVRCALSLFGTNISNLYHQAKQKCC